MELLDFAPCGVHHLEKSPVGGYCRQCGRIQYEGSAKLAPLEVHLQYLQDVADAKARAPSHLLRGTVVKQEQGRLAVKLAMKPGFAIEEGNLVTITAVEPMDALFEDATPDGVWTLRVLDPSPGLVIDAPCELQVPKFQTEAILLRIYSRFPEVRQAAERIVACQALPFVKPLTELPPSLLGLDDEVKRELLSVAANLPEGGILALRGPPGTGKTTTIAKLCNHVVKDRGESVLLMARNHQAVDQALDSVKKLYDGAVNRIGNPKKAAARHNPRRLSRYDEGGEFFDGLEGKPGVTGWTLDGAAFRIAQFLPDVCPQWDWCIVDEASLATLPYLGLAGLLSKRLLIVGDDRQLPPILDEAHVPPGPPTLQVTALEHFEAQGRQDLVKMLDTQRRSVAGIMDWSSRTVYGSRLQNGRPPQPLVSTLLGQAIHHPVVWLDTSRVPECRQTEPYATESAGNIAMAALVIAALHSQGVKANEILVLYPFTDQGVAWKNWLKTLKQQTGIKDWNGLEVSTVDASQGKEKRVVILDLVRNRPGLPHRGPEALKKLNVALTRGMELVLVIGPKSYANHHDAPAYASLAKWPHKTIVDAAAILDDPKKRERFEGALELQKLARSAT
jgi:hypothetical protein